MVAAPKPLLYVPRVKPAPNELTEQLVNGRLAELDPHFFIKWVPTAYWSDRHREFEGRYALCQRWTDNDPRRQWVREGKQSDQDAFDIWGWFCEDMHNAGSVPREPDAMLRKIFELLHKSDNTRFPWRQRVAEVAAHNQRVREQATKANDDAAKDAAIDAYYHSNRATRVFT